MGVLIRVNDANFQNYVGVADFPVVPELKNLYYMGTDATNTAKDNSGKGNNGTIVGTISYGDNYARFSSTGTSNVMRAQDIGQSASGVAGVALFKKTGNRAVFSVGGSTISGGVMFMTPSRFVFCTDTDTELQDKRYTLQDSDNYYVMGWRLTTSLYEVYLDTRGALSLISSGEVSGNNIKLYTGSTSNYKKLHVGGSSYNFALDGTLDLSVAAFYLGTPTLDQIKDAMAYLRTYGQHIGLTIN